MTVSNGTIFAAFRQLGITDEDEQRDLYERVTGGRRLTGMRPEQKDAVVDELRRLGFRETGSSRRPSERLSGRFAQAIRAFWLSGYNLGVFRNNDDRAILAFARSQTGLSHVQFAITPKDGDAIIEAIKAIVRREAGLPDLWRPAGEKERWRKDGRVQVVFGQWEMLGRLDARYAGASVFDWAGNPGGTAPFVHLDGTALIALQKALGKMIRETKARAARKAAA